MDTRRHRAGRANWLVVGGLAGLVVVTVLFAFSGESPEVATVRFMNALAKGDVDTLTAMSYTAGESKDAMKKEWEYAVKVAGPYYQFSYSIVSSVSPDSNSATVRMKVYRNINRGSSFEEKFELPLVKRDGQWKVDIRSLDRRLYPQLPRG